MSSTSLWERTESIQTQPRPYSRYRQKDDISGFSENISLSWNYSGGMWYYYVLKIWEILLRLKMITALNTLISKAPLQRSMLRSSAELTLCYRFFFFPSAFDDKKDQWHPSVWSHYLTALCGLVSLLYLPVFPSLRLFLSDSQMTSEQIEQNINCLPNLC